ncbi:hypothetical protein OG21DRAFT_1604587 [Imleria badia]|nr:hypothetical protein OG21DRAFT_1604587 [Imleria badia]
MSDSTGVTCEVCGRKIGRRADLSRHMKTHAENKEALKYKCPRCPFGALQLSNFKNHWNSFTGKRPYKCPEEGCTYRAAERGTLSKHRKSRHGYQSKKKYTHSTASSSTSGSLRTLDSSSPSSSVSPSPSDDHVEERNASSAYTTEFINDSHFAPTAPLEYAPLFNSEFLTTSEGPSTAYQQLPALDQSISRFNDWQYAESSLSPRMVSSSVAPVECAPLLNSGILAASEEPVTVHPHLPVDDQGELYGVGAAVQPVSQMSISEEEYDNFISRFNNWESAESSLSTPVVSSSVNVHAPATLPPYEGPYLINNVPTTTTLPPYEDQYSSLIPTPAALPPYAENTLMPITASPPMVSPSVAPVEYATSQLANSDRIRPHLPVHEQGELYAVGAAVQPVSQMYIGYDNSISRFSNWESSGSSLSLPMVPYNVDVHTPATLPPYEGPYLIDNVPTTTTLPPYEDQYGFLIPTPAPYAENTLIPTPASYFSYEAEPVNAAYEYYNPIADAASFGATSTFSQSGLFATPEVQSVNATYEYYNPATDAASFDATGTFAQPGSFATPDMGIYPQGFYPQDVDQGSFYNAYAGTSGFGMEGFYAN